MPVFVLLTLYQRVSLELVQLPRVLFDQFIKFNWGLASVFSDLLLGKEVDRVLAKEVLAVFEELARLHLFILVVTGAVLVIGVLLRVNSSVVMLGLKLAFIIV